MERAPRGDLGGSSRVRTRVQPTRVRRRQRGRPEMIVVWRVTERCNLSCAFCAYDRRVRRPRQDADPASILAFGAVLADYQHRTGDSVLVSWLGGEPLIWPPLAR